MIYEACKQKWYVIDAPPSMLLIHQNHDYSHLPNGATHYASPESNENIRLAGGEANIRYTILDSTRQLIKGKLARPQMSYLRFMPGLELFFRSVFSFLPQPMTEPFA